MNNNKGDGRMQVIRKYLFILLLLTIPLHANDDFIIEDLVVPSPSDTEIEKSQLGALKHQLSLAAKKILAIRRLSRTIPSEDFVRDKVTTLTSKLRSNYPLNDSIMGVCDAFEKHPDLFFSNSTLFDIALCKLEGEIITTGKDGSELYEIYALKIIMDTHDIYVKKHIIALLQHSAIELEMASFKQKKELALPSVERCVSLWQHIFDCASVANGVSVYILDKTKESYSLVMAENIFYFVDNEADHLITLSKLCKDMITHMGCW